MYSTVLIKTLWDKRVTVVLHVYFMQQSHALLPISQGLGARFSLSGAPWRFRDGRRLSQSDKIASKILVRVCPGAWLRTVGHLTWKGDRFSSMNFSPSLSLWLERELRLDMSYRPDTTLFASRLVRGSPSACFFAEIA